MKSQKLKSLQDFLKRAEIIPETLLFISKNTPSYEKVVDDFINIDFEIPFYELNLSEHPNLESELLRFFGHDDFPSLVYFRGKNIVNTQARVKKGDELTEFIQVSKVI
ncbi:MAG: hypothetical protein K2Q18_05865 [Bdellovibrionales bacterium]|nr:hypothetical protein [Bdellovibrionales bacterium]